MLRKTLDNLHLYRPYLLVTAVSVVLFFPTWARLFGQWLEFEQVLAHGLATGIIFLILLVIHPPHAPGKKPGLIQEHSLAGAVLLVLVTLAWALVELVRIDTLSYLLLPAGMLCVAWTLLGLNSALRFLPYVLLLSLSLPIWADFIPALVALASAVVSYWIQLFDMTALIEGNSITLPWGRLIIADGCSGIRYFAISILLAAVVSILNDYRWKGWMGLVTAAMVIGLIANWVRIFMLVVIGYQSRMQSPLLTDHEMLGWLVYGAFILPALYFAPARRRTVHVPETQPTTIFRKGFAALVIAFLVGPLAINLAQFTATAAPAWKPGNSELKPVEPSQLPVTLRLPASLNQELWQDGDGVWVSLAQSVRSPATDHKLVPYLRPTIDGELWLKADTRNNINIYQHLINRQKVAVSQWYQVGSYRAYSYRDAKLLQIPATLKGESRFALVTLLAACSPLSCDDATAAINERLDTIRLHNR
ncbi:exosortase/archaeosortase family protein [Marinobacter persicus]|uniref:Exosortase n=1 Tax=Marinobacter persicus TaxID=930118 RepID=A0A2S6G909_9GAMM|nr:exosortase/archaeosortase family protein [Marinobacter persicus]PPK52715.1 exosortase [Marinobacter persicus]PPK55739.1 exosortase [Marinobacter persicus]PPK59226.1 exosortase [Marinobacter persicus]